MTQTTGKGKSGSGKGKGKTSVHSNSGSRTKPPSKPGKPMKGTPSGTPKVTLPKAPEAVGPMNMSTDDPMALPVPALVTPQPSAVDPMDTKVSDGKEDNMEVDAVQETLNTMAAQTIPMEDDVIGILDDSSDGFVDAASPTQEGEQKLLRQVNRDKKAKAQADAKAQAAKAKAAKAGTKSQKSDLNSDTEIPVDIHAKVLHHRITEDELPTVPVHQLGKYTISRIPKPGHPVPEESDEDDDKIVNLYKQWMTDLSNPKNWEDCRGSGTLQGV